MFASARRPGRSPLLAACVAAAVMLPLVATPAGAAATAAPAASAAVVTIRVLSSRADVVTGGDALVEVDLPDGASAAGTRVTVGSADVTGAFRADGAGRLVGLVSGLHDGPNLVTATTTDGRGATITLTNHSTNGPVFAGPQVQPWFCTTQNSGLDKSGDASCNAPTKFFYFYKSTNPTKSGFQSYDPANPPSDVATTTTDQGRTVPYIVRDERGTLDRTVYDIALLWDPGKPDAQQNAWNHKLDYTFGGSCSPMHNQTNNSSATLSDMQLSRGFAMASSGLNVLGNNCNEVVSAEAMSMVKEHLVERYGPIRYTIGDGCSGGSIQQQQIASAYPGLLDGIQPACSFEDSWTTGIEVSDCELLVQYYQAGGLVSPAQEPAVNGHRTSGPCESWRDVYAFDRTVNDPRIGCQGLVLGPQIPTYTPPAYVYDPKTNPKGTRCTKQDYEVAILGTRPQDGFTKNGFDNVGVQYGLEALKAGTITSQQFLDVNDTIGGFDIDNNRQPARSEADPGAVAILYRAGRVTNGRELAKVPIIDLRGHDDEEIHTDVHSYATRARLDRDNGNHDNQVIFLAGTPLVIPANVTQKAFLTMDAWLAAIEADTSQNPLAVKVVKDKPAKAVDTCFQNDQELSLQQCYPALAPAGNPRTAAGGPLTDDVLKCQLKPIALADYGGKLTQADLPALQKAFPTGVCDFTKPGVDQQAPAGTWYSFADGPGGRPLGPTPQSEPFGGMPGAAVPEVPFAALLPLAGLLVAAAAVARRRRAVRR